MDEKHGKEEAVEAALAVTSSTPVQSWLEALYTRHSAAVLRTAYRVTGNLADAEDVLQTVFVRLARRKELPDVGDNALPYLRRAATNAALDVVQSKRAKTSSPLEAVPERGSDNPADSPEARHRERELHKLLRAAIAKLNQRAAEMFVLRFFEDLDNGEIATLFETSAGTVAVTLHRARARLLEDLQPHLGGLS